MATYYRPSGRNTVRNTVRSTALTAWGNGLLLTLWPGPQAFNIEAVCARHDVPLKAAALQCVLGHPAIATTVPGCRSVAQMTDTVAAFRRQIPAAFRAELKHGRLIRADAPVPA